jgi:hypothetical protein
VKPNDSSRSLLGLALGTGVGMIVTVGYFLLQALTVRNPGTTRRT